MMLCPACRHETKEGSAECGRCGVIFAKWKGPALAAADLLPDSTIAAPQADVALLHPCPDCGRELAGARIMEQRCPYCATMLPDGFERKSAPISSPPELPPTPEELAFAAQPVWKKIWIRHPWWVFWASVIVIALHASLVCLGGNLTSIPLMLLPVVAAMAPTLLLWVCPAHWPDGLILLGFCGAALRAALLATWKHSPQNAILWAGLIVLAVFLSNTLMGMRFSILGVGG